MDIAGVALNDNREDKLSEENDNHSMENLSHNDEDIVVDICNFMQGLQIDNKNSIPSPIERNLSPSSNILNSPPNGANRIRRSRISRFDYNGATGHCMDTRESETSLVDILEKMKEIRELSIPRNIYDRLDEQYSRKVFVGGLPPDIYEHQIEKSFYCFGPLIIDWPHKFESGATCFPPKGFAFLLYQFEDSVKRLIRNCSYEDNKLYWLISSKTLKDIPVEIRPWRVADADYIVDSRVPLDSRKTVFVGGVPRPMKAFELAAALDSCYGGVCYASIDTDTEHKYPKGSGRVTFNNQKSLIAAISDRFIQIQQGEICKQVEVKPYVVFDQMCDYCNGLKCYGRLASFFCANIMCLKYLCECCWNIIHSQSGRRYHKPFIKGFSSQPNTSFRRF